MQKVNRFSFADAPPFGEATMMIANDTLGMTEFIRCFCDNFADEAVIWFAYCDDNHNFKNPVKLQLDNWKDDEDATNNSLKEVVTRRILPTHFTLG